MSADELNTLAALRELVAQRGWLMVMRCLVDVSRENELAFMASGDPAMAEQSRALTLKLLVAQVEA